MKNVWKYTALVLTPSIEAVWRDSATALNCRPALERCSHKTRNTTITETAATTSNCSDVIRSPANSNRRISRVPNGKARDLSLRHLLGDAQQDQRDPNGRNDGRELGRVASSQRTKRDLVHQHRQQPANSHREKESDRQRQLQLGDGEQPGEGAPHEDRAVRQVEDVQDAEDQREAQRKQRIDTSQNEAVDKLLSKHASMTPMSPSELTIVRGRGEVKRFMIAQSFVMVALSLGAKLADPQASDGL